MAEALELDADNKTDRAKINGMLKIWRATGALKVIEEKDENREMREFVVVTEEG